MACLPIQNEHRSFPSLSIFLQHYYLLWCVWPKLNRIGSGTCYRETSYLFTPYQKTIGSSTCDRETPFLFTPPFHHTIKKLCTPHQQQHYRYYFTREKFKSWLCLNDSRKRSLTLSPGLGCDGLHRERRWIRHVDTGQLSWRKQNITACRAVGIQ